MESTGDEYRDTSGLRRRKIWKEPDDSSDDNEDAQEPRQLDFKPVEHDTDEIAPRKYSYWLTRILLLRYIGFIYCELDF